MTWTGPDLAVFVGEAIGTGVCVRMVVEGLAWIWSFVTDGVRSVGK